MFNNNKDNEADFCESYKSQVLGTAPIEKETSFFSTLLKLLTILILLTIIIGVSFYGYNYFTNKKSRDAISLPPVSVQISDEDLVVEPEDVVSKEAIIKKEDIDSELAVVKVSSPVVNELDMDKMANDVKIAMAESELKEENNSKEKTITKVVDKVTTTVKEINDTTMEDKSLEIPTLAPEAKYLEELADLSKEIDKERKN